VRGNIKIYETYENDLAQQGSGINFLNLPKQSEHACRKKEQVELEKIIDEEVKAVRALNAKKK
jgi:hypothetical protein